MITHITVILNILAWPVALVIVAFLWKRHIPALLQRTTKVSFYGLELELASEIERSTKWSIEETGDVRKVTPVPEYNSYLTSLLEEFRKKDGYDYAIINLDHGEGWLTSRLYIFSLMLHRMCGLRCWVFVEPGAGINLRFLGFARPTEVRWALARRYPYLEEAFIKAQSKVLNFQIESLQGRLPSHQAADLVLHFLRAIQEGYDLRLMSIDKTADLVDDGRFLVIVALVDTHLHIRVFDASGEKIIDKAENELVNPEIETDLAAFKQRVKNSLHEISTFSQKDKQEIIKNAISIAGHPEIPGPPENSWVALSDSAKWEHAEWLKSSSLRGLLGTVLQETAIPSSEDKPKDERLEAVLRQKGDFVALVAEGQAFRGLVDRNAVLEDVASRLA